MTTKPQSLILSIGELKALIRYAKAKGSNNGDATTVILSVSTSEAYPRMVNYSGEARCSGCPQLSIVSRL